MFNQNNERSWEHCDWLMKKTRLWNSTAGKYHEPCTAGGWHKALCYTDLSAIYLIYYATKAANKNNKYA